MYIINDNRRGDKEYQIAVEDGDKISIVRDGGGKVDVMVGATEAMNCEDGPHTITDGEEVIISILPKLPF